MQDSTIFFHLFIYFSQNIVHCEIKQFLERGIRIWKHLNDQTSWSEFFF